MFSSVILGISFLLEASFLGIGIRKLYRMMNKTLQHGRGDRAASGSVQHKPIVFQDEKKGAGSGKDPSGPRRRRRTSASASGRTARRKKDPVFVGSAKPYQIDIRKA